MTGLAATMRSALAEAAAKRGALVAQISVMLANDLVWLVFWLLFFRQVGTVRGWDADSVLMLLAVLTSAGGITLGLVSNARAVGRMALAGELDSVLTLPVPPLAYVLVRRVEPVNLGDLVFGLVLFATTGSPTPVRTVVFLAVVAASAVLMTSFLVLTSSLAFFFGRNEGGELGLHALLLLGAYPVDMFAGAVKVILYSVVPAVFVSNIPARLVQSFDVAQAVWLAVVSGAFALAAWTAFTVGLRRYTSGSVWTRA